MNEKLKKILSGVGVLAAFGLGGAAIAGAQGDKPAASQPATAQSEAKEAAEGDGREEERDEQATGPEAERARDAALKATGGGKVLSVEREEDEKEERTEKSETESEDKGGDKQEGFQSPEAAAWEVEVTKTDGTQVEVYLDKDYKELATHKADADE